MEKMTKGAWFLVGLFVLGAAAGVYQLATERKRAHLARVEAVTREANAKVARENAALERKWATDALPKKAPAPTEPDRVDVAYALCAKLRQAGASTCEPHFSFWSGSYVDATIGLAPQFADSFCRKAAATVRTSSRPLAGMQLKLYSPLGSGRPMAVCDL